MRPRRRALHAAEYPAGVLEMQRRTLREPTPSMPRESAGSIRHGLGGNYFLPYSRTISAFFSSDISANVSTFFGTLFGSRASLIALPIPTAGSEP